MEGVSDRKETGYVPEGMTEAGRMDWRNRVGVWRRYIGVDRRYIRANRRYVRVGRRCIRANRRDVRVGRRDVRAKRRCVGASRRCVGVGMDVTVTFISFHFNLISSSTLHSFHGQTAEEKMFSLLQRMRMFLFLKLSPKFSP